jgi:hypothetical protein
VRTAAVGILAVWFIGAAGAPALAQETNAAPAEDLEPRIVGKRGMTSIGFAGFFDRFYSPQDVFPTHYMVQVDGQRFVTRRFAVRLGVVGTSQFGGDADDEEPTGAAAAALHALGGVHFYFTPQSMVSLYLGTEYWMQITDRADSDWGSAVGKGGIQGALSSRVSFFFEAGFGSSLRRGSEGELLTRIVGQVGLRIKL